MRTARNSPRSPRHFTTKGERPEIATLSSEGAILTSDALSSPHCASAESESKPFRHSGELGTWMHVYSRQSCLLPCTQSQASFLRKLKLERIREWPGCLQTSPSSNAKNFWAVCPCTICLLHVLGTGFDLAELSPYFPTKCG